MDYSGRQVTEHGSNVKMSTPIGRLPDIIPPARQTSQTDRRRSNIRRSDEGEAKLSVADNIIFLTSARGTFTVRSKTSAPASRRSERVRAPISAGRTVAKRT